MGLFERIVKAVVQLVPTIVDAIRGLTRRPPKK